MPSIWTSERLLKLMIFVCFLIVAAFGFIVRQQIHLDNQLSKVNEAQEHLKTNQIDNTVRAATTRAIACRIEHAILIGASDVCYSPEVLRHWDPETSSSPHYEQPER